MPSPSAFTGGSPRTARCWPLRRPSTRRGPCTMRTSGSTGACSASCATRRARRYGSTRWRGSRERPSRTPSHDQDAFCTAGERAETKRNADIGTEIAIFKDGVKISHYVMIERMNLWNEKVKEWEYRLC